MQVRLGRAMTPAEARQLLQSAPGLKVLDVPGERVYPMPMLVTADDAIHVGRIRAFAGSADVLELVAAIDNAGATARLCLEVAELVGRAPVTTGQRRAGEGVAMPRRTCPPGGGAGRDSWPRACYPSGGCAPPSARGWSCSWSRARPWPNLSLSPSGAGEA